MGDSDVSDILSDIVCWLGLLLSCKCLVEGVQCSASFQDFTRSIHYIRPLMERRDVR